MLVHDVDKKGPLKGICSLLSFSLTGHCMGRRQANCRKKFAYHSFRCPSWCHLIFKLRQSENTF